jgi:hypothetical protein
MGYCWERTAVMASRSGSGVTVNFPPRPPAGPQDADSARPATTGSVRQQVYPVWRGLATADGESAVEDDIEGMQCGLPSHGPASPAGTGLMTAVGTHVSAAASFGKCPRERTALRIRALTDSIALVVQTTRRISASNWKNGTKLGPGARPEPHDRAVCGAPLFLETPGTYGARKIIASDRDHRVLSTEPMPAQSSHCCRNSPAKRCPSPRGALPPRQHQGRRMLLPP